MTQIQTCCIVVDHFIRYTRLTSQPRCTNCTVPIRHDLSFLEAAHLLEISCHFKGLERVFKKSRIEKHRRLKEHHICQTSKQMGRKLETLGATFVSLEPESEATVDTD